MCTPRNLVLLTLSTAAPSMVSWGSGVGTLPLEMDYNLFGLLDVQVEVVISTLRGQLANFLPVIVVGDETNHSCVVRKVPNVVFR